MKPLKRISKSKKVKTIFFMLNLSTIIFFFLLTVVSGQDLLSETGVNTETDISTIKENFSRHRQLSGERKTQVKDIDFIDQKEISPMTGGVDLSFNPIIDRSPGNARSVVVQPDGKVLIGGVFVRINGINRPYIFRLNTDGSFDSTFNALLNNSVYDIELQPDGKIVVVGGFTLVNGVSRNRIARLNSNGSLDTSFDTGNGANSTVLDSAFQPDGKIVLVGSFNILNNFGRNYIARLNQDGSLDTNFNPNADALGWTVAVQPDGKILMGGNFSSVGNTNVGRLVRLNDDGSIDNTFLAGRIMGGSVLEVIRQSDGKILVGGGFGSYSGVGRSRIARINSDGSLDTTFNPGTGGNTSVWSIFQRTDGKILVGGSFSTFNGMSKGGIVQLNSDGSLDNIFNPISGSNGTIYNAKVLPNGQIIAVGSFTLVNGLATDTIALFNADGSLGSLSSFNSSLNGRIYAVVAQDDGKIIVGGTFSQINGVTRNNIARLNSDGSLDSTFNPGGGANNYIYTIAIEPLSNKILIGGQFTSYDSTSRNHIARLNTNGTIDSTFDPGAGTNGLVANITANAGIFVGGDFNNFNSQSVSGFVKLNNNGSLDNSFNIPQGMSYIEGIVRDLNNDKIIIAGDFDNINGVPKRSIARLNTDGTLDTSFSPPDFGVTNIYALKMQNDGKFLVGGDFDYSSFSDGAPERNGIVRLNTNGSLDTTFNPGVFDNADGFTSVEDIEVLSNGKILVGGSFINVSGLSHQNIVRLNVDGSVDNTFNISADLDVYDITIEDLFTNQRKILIGGLFGEVNNNPQSGLSRIFNDFIFKTFMDFDGDGKSDISVFRPSNGAWYINQSTNGFTGVTFGFGTDRLAPADFDGDGKTDVGVFRDGNWYYLKSSDNSFVGLQWGLSTDIPIPADFDGDGKADVNVFRPSNGGWYRLNSSDNSFYGMLFGQNGDKPLIADFDGDGKNDITVFRPSTGSFYSLDSSTGNFRGAAFGFGTDIPTLGDFDGDGKTDIAVFRPSNGAWYRLNSSTGAFFGTLFGQNGDIPVAADFDGDGRTDIAVFRNGNWYYLNSSNGAFVGQAFGFGTDKPIPAAFQ